MLPFLTLRSLKKMQKLSQKNPRENTSLLLLFTFFKLFFGQCSYFILRENTKKPRIFCCFQEVEDGGTEKARVN